MKARGSFLFLISAVLLLCGCSEQTYTAARLKESIADICLKEYNIPDVDVKIAGDTVGVYVPLEKLFTSDLHEAIESGRIASIEKLFEPSPEAFDKIENVLFSISRVLLSADKDFKFYVLQAADVVKTGQQIVITGMVDDVRRVRIWDISRNDYRKRIVSEWGYNRVAIWNRPVRQFLKDLTLLSAQEIQFLYFKNETSEKVVQNLFLHSLKDSKQPALVTAWTLSEIRDLQINDRLVVAYAKVKPVPGPAMPREKAETYRSSELRFFFMIGLEEQKPAVIKVIPFQYLDAEGKLRNVTIPPELQFEDSKNWLEEFKVQNIQVGDFLAGQITRRVQGLLAEDERIHNTFRELKIIFEYHPDEPEVPASFSLLVDGVLRDSQPKFRRSSVILHEDMSYALNLALREFVDVLRSYHFEKFDFLKITAMGESNPQMLKRDKLELFRKKKILFAGLFPEQVPL